MRQPIGIELVRRGVIAEEDITKALEYQKSHPNKKIGDILNTLGVCDSNILIQAIGEILGEKPMLLDEHHLKLNLEDYISLDVLRQNKAVPFEIENGKIKVCFSDTANKKAVETIRLLLLNKGLVMEKYITFESNIEKVLKSFDINYQKNLLVTANDISDVCAYMTYIQLALYGLPAIVYCGNALTGETRFKMETPLYFLQSWKFRKAFIQKPEDNTNKQKESIVDKTIQDKFKEVMVKGNCQISLF